MKMNVFTFQGHTKNNLTRDIKIISKSQKIGEQEAKYRLQLNNIVLLSKNVINTESYITNSDNLPSHIKSGYAQKQYKKGRELINQGYDYVILSFSGSWGAGSYERHQYLTAYETIGLHAHTKELINGFYNNNIPIIDCRLEN